MRRLFRVLTILTLTGLTLFAAGLPALAQEKPEFLAGKFLVAAPAMPDGRFQKTVILVLEHSEKGAVGLVVNRPVREAPLSYLMKGFRVPGHEDATGTVVVHSGGPVDPASAYVVHSPEYARGNTVKVTPGLAMSAAVVVLQDLARGKGPKQLMLAFGASGWGPGQLEAELKKGGWIVTPSDPALVFMPGTDAVWEAARKREGIEL